MLFQMSFLRGFLQSHFIKHKACSELLQEAFVIGTCTRSLPESFPTKRSPKYVERITTYVIQTTSCSLSSLNIYSLNVTSEFSFSFFLFPEIRKACATYMYHG